MASDASMHMYTCRTYIQLHFATDIVVSAHVVSAHVVSAHMAWCSFPNTTGGHASTIIHVFNVHVYAQTRVHSLSVCCELHIYCVCMVFEGLTARGPLHRA